MHQHKLTYPEAFEQLRGASQRENLKLGVVADTVLCTGALPQGH